MSTILSTGVAVLFVVAAALLWPAMYAIWSRAMVDPSELELGLWRALRLRGIARKHATASEPDLSHAVYRCITCKEFPRCEKLLDAGRAPEIDAFCPNRDFIAGCTARHRQQ